MNNINVPIVEIYLCDPTGVRLECIDYLVKYEYNLKLNNKSPFSITLPNTFNKNLLRLDNIVEFWRGSGYGNLKLDYCGFLRAWDIGNKGGADFIKLGGYSINELLIRRVVADYAGSAEADKYDNADDIMKAVVREQLGSGAGTGRDLTVVGGGFTVANDVGKASSITKAFSYKNVLDVLRAIADTSFAQFQELVYFDIVPIVNNTPSGMLALEFRTYFGQRNNNRSSASYYPVFVGTDFENMDNIIISEDHYDEGNVAYALGAGEGANRDIVTVILPEAESSIWNRREISKDARDADPNDTTYLTGEANEALGEVRPLSTIDGSIIHTDSFVYGRDWNFGDRLTVVTEGVQRDAIVYSVSISCDEDGEKIDGKLAYVDDITAVGGGSS